MEDEPERVDHTQLWSRDQGALSMILSRNPQRDLGCHVINAWLYIHSQNCLHDNSRIFRLIS